MIKKILKSWVFWFAIILFGTGLTIGLTTDFGRTTDEATEPTTEVVETVEPVDSTEVVVPVDTLSVENIEEITTTPVTKDE